MCHAPLEAKTKAKIHAGFPSPATNFLENKLNLNKRLIKNPLATYFITAEGDSLKNSGINNGDILIVDRSKSPSNNDIVVAIIDGEFVLKRYLVIKNGEPKLTSDSDLYPTISLTEDIEIWGVVTYSVHTLNDIY